MNQIDLNDLPRWSLWPSRLFGLNQWKVPVRTVEKVDQEYDKDKYAKCLAYYINGGGKATPEEVKQFEFGSKGTVCVSLGNSLMGMSLDEARARFYSLLVNTMRREIEQSASVVELGCGYGYNLWMLKQHFAGKEFRGGEYSSNAVNLASHFFARDSEIEISPFNFYEPSYEVLDTIQQPVTVFTVHAVEQLPGTTPFFEALRQYRDKIKAIFHFEPLYEIHDDTLLGLMRKRYNQANDYNRDLLSQLKQRSKLIRLVRMQADVFGLNPLNPTSVIQWEFIS
jgi:hypothetical protein